MLKNKRKNKMLNGRSGVIQRDWHKWQHERPLNLLILSVQRSLNILLPIIYYYFQILCKLTRVHSDHKWNCLDLIQMWFLWDHSPSEIRTDSLNFLFLHFLEQLLHYFGGLFFTHSVEWPPQVSQISFMNSFLSLSR